MKPATIKSSSLSDGFVEVREIGSSFFTGVSQEDRDALWNWTGSQRFHERDYDLVLAKLSRIGYGLQVQLEGGAA